MLKVKIVVLFFIIVFPAAIQAQYKYGLAHEIGVFGGPVQFRSDYGESNDAQTNFGNTGYGFGLVHFLGFSYVGYGSYIRDNYFRQHFKLRSEISYNKTNFKHYGDYVNGGNSIGRQKLRAMYGSTSMISFGSELQFFPLMDLHEFENTDYAFAPYISLGAQYSNYTSVAASTFGAMGTPETTASKYLIPSDGKPFGFANESKGVVSIVSSVGTRFKINPMNDLFLDLRFQYFNSDWVDGLNPNKERFTENKSNDWLVWLNFGYVLYLQ